MNIPTSLHTDVRDLLFSDWAEVVTFVEVSTTYDPQVGEASESISESDVLAILGPGLDAPVPNTAHQHTKSDRTFLIRAEDLPPNASFATSRIRWHGHDYAIQTADHAPQTNLVVFHTTFRS
jgi:hypothetical protein